MRIWICGVRGSTSAPGVDFARVGGHTSCVAIGHDGRPPTLVLDAGTGLRRVTALLDDSPFRGTLLLGHLHWDHTEGLPFFGAGDRSDASVRVMVPEQPLPAAELIGNVMSPPNFPIVPDQLGGDWSFEHITTGDHVIEGFDVLALEIPHKGGRTFGYRITDPQHGSSVAYLSDHAPQTIGPGPHGAGEMHDTAVALAAGVDLLIHDAQYTMAELVGRGDYGHSAAPYAAQLAEHCGARRVLLTHHDPSRTDAEVEAVGSGVARDHPNVCVDIAREGMVIDL